MIERKGTSETFAPAEEEEVQTGLVNKNTSSKMDTSKVYWASIEYLYLKESTDYRKLVGGFVYGFVRSNAGSSALNRLTEELKNKNLGIKIIEFISQYDIEIEWETEVQTKLHLELYKEANSSNSVILGDFYAYESEE